MTQTTTTARFTEYGLPIVFEVPGYRVVDEGETLPDQYRLERTDIDLIVGYYPSLQAAVARVGGR